MRIASAAVQMEARHSEQQQHEISSSLRSWVVDNTNVAADAGSASATPAAPLVQISDGGRALQTNEAASIQQAIDDAENDPTLRMIRSLVAMLTGKDIRSLRSHQPQPDASTHIVEQAGQARSLSVATVSNAATPAAPARSFGIEYTRRETYRESEQSSFAASGVVTTADGRQINFAIALSMSRSYSEQSETRILFGSARQTQDPLTINFAGSAAQLTDQRFEFDLDADGDQESINFVSGGSGFLALDRNGDGQINDGSELFGTASGDGFADLAALDSDNNGWIDENDAAYEQLRVWTKDSSGNDQLATLKESDVGAIGLAHTATPFSLKDESNALQGEVRATGVFLHENGLAGTVQQIDLTV